MNAEKKPTRLHVNAVTRTDVLRDHVAPCLDGHGFTAEQVEAIMDDVIAAAPADSWRDGERGAWSPLMDGDEFWAIVARHDA